MSVEKLITDHIDIWSSALQTRSTAGRGSNGKINLYGIKKLRELILVLAVRGKLVPQDPNDEPASELLKRIAAEKAELVKQGKIKKQKPLPAISEDEKPFELPKGWEWVRLGDVVEILDHQRKPVTKEARSSGEYPYYGASGIVDYIDDYIFDDQLVLVGEDGAKWNKGDKTAFCISGKAWVNNHAHVIKPFNSFFLNEFISCYLTAIDLSEYITGTTVPKLNQAKLVSIPVPLSSLNTQSIICSKVDELMHICDQLEQQSLTNLDAHQQLVETLLATLTDSQNAEELTENWARISQHFGTLFTTESSIDTLKQTILQLAVMGKLVPQDPNDEPAAELLRRIEQEKAQLVKEGKIKKQKPLPPVSEEEKPFELPRGWAWCRVSNVAMFTTSGSRDWAKYYSEKGALFVTMGNLSRDSYNLRMDNIRYVSPPKGGEGLRTRLEAFDLIISITGDVGNLGLIPDEFGEAYINQHTCLLRFTPTCQNYYFAEFMRSPVAKAQFDAPQRGIKNSFRLSDVEEMYLPLPPLKEQYRIAEKIKEYLSICDQLKSRLQTAQQTQLHLADALTGAALN